MIQSYLRPGNAKIDWKLQQYKPLFHQYYSIIWDDHNNQNCDVIIKESTDFDMCCNLSREEILH